MKVFSLIIIKDLPRAVKVNLFKFLYELDDSYGVALKWNRWQSVIFPEIRHACQGAKATVLFVIYSFLYC